MKNTLETRLGLFFALALIAAFIVLEVIGSLDVFRRSYRVHGRFDNVYELNAGDPVKMAGYPIGRVERIRIEGNRVRVTMKIDRDEVIRTDSKATIKFAGLLGQNFVSIDFGSPTATVLGDDQDMQTESQPDLNTLMARLDKVASGIDELAKSIPSSSIQDLVAITTDILQENKPRLSAILTNMQAISGQVATGQGTFGRLVMDDTLYQTALSAVTNLNETATDIKLTINDARSIVTNISTGKGTLGLLAKDETLYRETTAAMTNLHGILLKINQGTGAVGKLVNDPELYRNVKLSLQKLDKAAEGLEDQGPLSVIGIAVGALF